jgi:cysteinyl-tRNA synthetase
VLRLHDTATGAVSEVRFRAEGQASLYVCGPTVYDAPHLGHGRFSLVFDVLRRYLLFGGRDVTYVSNITDIDDKVIERARLQGVEPAELTSRYEAVWWDAMADLSVLRPDETPHATAYVGAMVETIAELETRGVAYETSDGVYLEVAKVPGYGLLAHQPLESLRAGARVDAIDEKRSPLDFVLWKKAKPGEPTWSSPWGPGRPGWHTECVVMSLGLLGDGFDIHGGAIDLIFPHHENERAQAVALGRDFAHHWVHNGWVTVGGEKMSKSLGNFTGLDDLLAHGGGRAYRLLVLRSHYRSPIEVTPETVADAEAGLSRLDELARRFSLAALGAGGTPIRRADHPEIDGEALDRFTASMDNDLDTPGAVAGIFELVRKAHTAADGGEAAHAERLARTVSVLCGALGLDLAGPVAEATDPVADALVQRRDAARERRDWASADALRDELVSRGWVVEDSPTGTRIRRAVAPGGDGAPGRG